MRKQEVNVDNLQKNRQVVEKIIFEAKGKGYVTTDDIFAAIDVADLPIDDVERICDMLVDRGIIIRNSEDTDEVDAQKDETGYLSERSKVDYDKIFLRAIDIDESLHYYINNLKHIAPPGRGEEYELAYKAREGNKYARNRLIAMHLKVVVRIALSYFDKYAFPLADTIQNGNTGLLIALEKMPLTPEYRFSTYAPWWVMQLIMRDNNSFGNKFYVPIHLREKLYQTADLFNGHNCVECYETNEYCKELTREIVDKISKTTEKATYYLSLLEQVISLDEVLQDDNNLLFSDNNLSMDMLIDDIMYEECRKTIASTLDILTPREKKVIIERFGLNANKPKTLEEIGGLFGVTRERIRQIEVKAIARLRHPRCSKILKNFY